MQDYFNGGMAFSSSRMASPAPGYGSASAFSSAPGFAPMAPQATAPAGFITQMHKPHILSTMDSFGLSGTALTVRHTGKRSHTPSSDDVSGSPFAPRYESQPSSDASTSPVTLVDDGDEKMMSVEDSTLIMADSADEASAVQLPRKRHCGESRSDASKAPAVPPKAGAAGVDKLLSSLSMQRKQQHVHRRDWATSSDLEDDGLVGDPQRKRVRTNSPADGTGAEHTGTPSSSPTSMLFDAELDSLSLKQGRLANSRSRPDDGSYARSAYTADGSGSSLRASKHQQLMTLPRAHTLKPTFNFDPTAFFRSTLFTSSAACPSSARQSSAGQGTGSASASSSSSASANNTYDAYCVVDGDGVIVECNDGLAELLKIHGKCSVCCMRARLRC